MATSIELVDGYEVVEPGLQVKIQVVNQEHPNKQFTLKIHRRSASSPRQPDSDPVVDQTTQQSDDSGAAVFVWSPNEENISVSGPGYRYYPSVDIENGPQRQLPQASADSDLVALDIVSAVLHELVVSLGPVMAIPVYAEVSKDCGVSTRRDFDFTWDNWQTNYKPVVFTLSGSEEALKTFGTDYTVDYKNGKVLMNSDVPRHVEIEASYVFGYFSNQELLSFLNMSMNDINYIPPYTNFSIRNFPDYWRSIVISGALVRCLEQLFMAPIFRERRLIFSDEDMNGALINYYERVKQAFEAALTKKNRWSLTTPRGVTGHDVIAPPRISAHNFTQWAYLRGRGF